MSATIARARRARLTAALRSAGYDLLVVYGNSWQSDYLRYVTDFGLLESHGIATIDAAGAIVFFVESAVDGARAALEVPDVECGWFPTRRAPCSRRWIRLADGARRRSVRVATARDHRRSERDRGSTALVDVLLMHSCPRNRRQFAPRARSPTRPTRCFASRPPRATAVRTRGRRRGLSALARLRGEFHAGRLRRVDVRGMVPPSERVLVAGDLVTTELTPETDGYYAQICRTLVVGKANEAQRAASAVFLEALEAGIAAIRPAHARPMWRGRRTISFATTVWVDTRPARTRACAATASACSPTASRICWRT